MCICEPGFFGEVCEFACTWDPRPATRGPRQGVHCEHRDKRSRTAIYGGTAVICMAGRRAGTHDSTVTPLHSQPCQVWTLAAVPPPMLPSKSSASAPLISPLSGSSSDLAGRLALVSRRVTSWVRSLRTSAIRTRLILILMGAKKQRLEVVRGPPL